MWKVERAKAVQDPRRPSYLPVVLEGWETLYAGNSEVTARRTFTNAEMEALGTGHIYQEIKLWCGDDLRLHVWWNR